MTLEQTIQATLAAHRFWDWSNIPEAHCSCGLKFGDEYVWVRYSEHLASELSEAVQGRQDAAPASDPNVGRLEIRHDGICRCVEEVPNGLRWKLVLTNEQLESAIKFAAESERLRGEAK